jgi:hypothetical protein
VAFSRLSVDECCPASSQSSGIVALESTDFGDRKKLPGVFDF